MTTRIKHLYIHVPFCNGICYYCDFARRIYDEKLADKWLDRLEREIEENCHDQYETIYIGGGTPSCLSLKQSERLLRFIYPYASKAIEYTIEANPESLDSGKISLYKQYGVNRISLGVQSSNDILLKTLNRAHDFNTVKNKIRLLKDNSLTNISIDLMYSLPGQDMDILKNTLEDILKLDVPHLSLYSLTIEENSVFGKKGISSLDEDVEMITVISIMKFPISPKRTMNRNIIWAIGNMRIFSVCLSGLQERWVITAIQIPVI